MRRRNYFLKMAGLGAVSLSLPVCATSALAEDSDPMTKPPNFILILSDDHGWSGTSVAMDPNNPDSKSDYIETPNLERLAARGMRFSNAYSPAAMCSPTPCAIQY